MKAALPVAGHLAALFSILVWGMTFISTKVLLRDLTPVEILFSRFAVGWLALWIACPRIMRVRPARREWLFAGAGASGITLYFLFENIALTYTWASNVGVIVAVAPFFTAILAWLLPGGERPRPAFFAGFAIAISGIALTGFSGAGGFSANLAGDVLALLAAAVWAVYSLCMRAIAARGYGSLQATRRTFFYGLLFMLPCLPAFGFSFAPTLAALGKPLDLFNILFLGLVASALCFAAWTFAIRRLGAVRTSVYIYLVPVVTVIASALILGERLSLLSGAGCALTVGGLLISEGRGAGRGPRTESKQGEEQ